MDIKKNILLKEHTTFRLGGPARYFVEVADKDHLLEAITWAKQHSLPIFILGGGSNLLISEAGFSGLVIKPINRELKVDGCKINLGAGCFLSSAVAFSARSGLAGLTWGAGIPGTIGGAIRGNAGAYGSDISDSVTVVEVLDLTTLTFKIWSKADCSFSYRHSRIKNDRQFLIWSAELTLEAGDSNKLQAEAKKIILERSVKMPKGFSAGCVFKNIIVAEVPDSAQDFKTKYSDKIRGGKVAAGLLIESLNYKGKQFGGAEVSSEHANFVVNTGQAKSEDVYNLLKDIRKYVFQAYGIDLQVEIELIGFDKTTNGG